MKKIFKSFLAVILCFIMLIGTIAIGGDGFADLLEAISVKASAVEVVKSGNCGTNVTWTLDDGGTLTISGTGVMTNYSSPSNVPPWCSSRSSVKTVVIEAGVASIGDCAFDDCTCLTDITIPDSVTSIGDCAFLCCHNLTSITIPNSVASIGDCAFDDCTCLTDITIPDSVTSIGKRAFANCTSLTSIIVNINSKNYCDVDGTLFNKSRTAILCFPLGKTNESYTIPDSVTSICDYAFEHCDSLTNITIPDSVTSIGDCAFDDCTCLTNITIPDSVTSIGYYAFEYCDSLTNITIPSSVTNISNNAFECCQSLTSMTVDAANKVYDSRNNCNAIIDSKTNTLISGCRNTVIPDSVTSIGESAFKRCKFLTSIIIPDSVTSIGESAFEDCSCLTSITIPDSVTSICGWAFSCCNSLTSITIPDSVTVIGKFAFYRCTSLKNITIPDSVTSIGDYAFENCTGLTDVYYTGSESDKNNIKIGSDNDDLLNATWHYNPSAYSSLTQEYVVTDEVGKSSYYSGIEEKNKYSKNNWEAMNGENNVEMIIPGIKQRYVPQGLAYYEANNWILISAYDKDKENASVILALDYTTGEFVEEFDILKSNGSIFKGHVGGIAVSDYNLYISCDHGVAYIPLSKLKARNKKVLKENIKICGTTDFLGLGSTNVAYLDISDDVLWAGNFYSSSGWAVDDDWSTKTPWAHSSMVGFKLRGNSSSEEWENITSYYQQRYNLVIDDGISVPDYHINFPNSIECIQGATVYDKKLYLSRTTNASFGCAVSVCSFDVSNFQTTEEYLKTKQVSTSDPLILDCGKSVTLSDNKFIDITNLPGAENIEVIDGYLYCVYESGALHYCKSVGWITDIKDHSDVIWRMPLNASKKSGKSKHTYNCPIDIEVYDESDTLVCKIVNNEIDTDVTETDGAIPVEVYGDTKTFWTDNDSSYTIKVTGNDEGTMNYTVVTYDEDYNETARANFFDIPITESTALTSIVTAEDFELKSYTLTDENSNVIEQSEEFNGASVTYTISTSVSGNGTITESSEAVSGDKVTVTATANTGSHFLGWYENDTLVSSEAEYSFVAKDSRNLVAKFGEHTKEDVVSSAVPTCTEDGGTTYKCSVCNEEYTITIPATGHTAAEVVKENEVDSTCAMAGSYDNVVYCSVCNAEINRETITVPLKEHTPEAVSAVAPTCTETGLIEGTKCSVCGTVLTGLSEIPATGHSDCYTTIENVIDATATSEGSYNEVTRCSVCNDIVSSKTITTNSLSVLSYVIKDGKVLISRCDQSASGILVIPDTIEGCPVTRISSGSFYSCSYLTDIILPETIETIEDEAFAKCTSIEEIDIPDSVVKIGDEAFISCHNLTSINVGENNNSFASVDGVLYTKDLTKLITYPTGRTGEIFSVPNNVVEIESYAFANCRYIKNITISNSVTSIGMAAFINCANLNNINIPDSVINIGANILGNTMIYNNQDYWDNGIFYYDNNLLNVDSSFSGECKIRPETKVIADAAFFSCNNLTGVEIPDSVVNIGNRTFSSCQGLESVIIPGSVISTGKGTFSNCTGLQSLIISDGVLKIDDNAFSDCINLTNIFIPKSIINVGLNSFKNCYIETVCYSGASQDRNNIEIDDGNDNLKNATWHYNAKSEDVHYHLDSNGDGYCDICDTVTDTYLASQCQNAVLNANGGSVDYRTKVTIKATANNVPLGCYIVIYDGNTQVAIGNNNSVSYYVGEMKSDKNYTVKVVDWNGNVQKNSSGFVLQKDITIHVNVNFIKKLVAFFKGLFGSLPSKTIQP